jgi:hypothetical protein
MESEGQQSKYIDTTSTEPVASPEGSEVGTQPLLPPATAPNSQWQQTGVVISDFLEQLPEYIGKLFTQYKRPIISIALILAAIVTFKLTLALLDAIDDIPLVNSFFELVGVSYIFWLVVRYLLKASTRQELVTQIRSLQQDIFGEQDS